MKIIHCADLHIDSKMQTHLTKEKAKERRNELILSFERMVNFANEQNVQAIIIAGDMFDNSLVSSKSKNRIFNIIESHPNIDFLYLSGNHDEDNILKEITFNNLKLFTDKWTYFNYENITITGIRLNEFNASSYNTLSLNKDNFNIAVMHGEVANYNTTDKSKINLSKLKNKNINYLALGHIHSYSKNKLDDNGIYCYSGCLEGRGFDECGKKGFVLLNIENNKLTDTFIPFATRTFYEIPYDISNKTKWFEIENEIINSLKDISKNDLVRVVLIGKYNINLEKQISILSKKLNDLFYYAQIKDESTLKIDIKDFENDLSLKGEFIRLVLKSSLTETEKEQVLIYGLKSLDGEEIE